MAKSFIAVAVQPEVRAYYVTGKEPIEQRRENIEHYCDLIDRFVLEVEHLRGGRKPKLMVFPENFVNGFGPQRVRTWDTTLTLSIEIPGEETDILGKKAKEHDLYIAGSCYERPSKDLPNNIYMTGFIIDPDGKVALKYRKINAGISTGIAFTTSPHDIWDKVSHKPEDLFPVLETPYGCFGMIVCYDAHFPETSRCLALNGAEVLIHPSQWFQHTYNGIDQWILRNRARAYENMAYLVASNWALSPLSEYKITCGHSMITDYLGKIVEELPHNMEDVCSATIDINALRERRLSNELDNYLTSLRTEPYAQVYASKTIWPPSLLSDKKLYNFEELWKEQEKIRSRLKEEGILHEPE